MSLAWSIQQILQHNMEKLVEECYATMNKHVQDALTECLFNVWEAISGVCKD